ncbi:hypothetical protein K431DRAFT_307814 [Polychaeton citri CBS 116435]|uniref:EF-hand domain-containing protein n=1 Tax=Polychaeton citri CBS 116435 TaxID=1314669 RepID=A0A9P4UK56_9PEZI|nr:hypothetical protein K431DRAFT_307814 [Polychaeton citri CBS 116435]
MTTPADERPEPTYSINPATAARTSESQDRSLPNYNLWAQNNPHNERSSDEEGTVVGDGDHKDYNARPQGSAHLTVETDHDLDDQLRLHSPSQTREQAHRLDDDLEMLKIERQVSRQVAEDDVLNRVNSKGEEVEGGVFSRSKSRKRDEHVDEFDVATNPVHEKTQLYKPVENPSSGFGKFVKKVHQSNFVVRWVVYITPLTLILLIPLLLGALKYKNSPHALVGGVELMWFMIWLEIVWLTLWLGRLIAKCLPWPIGIVATLFTNNSKKWRDMGKQLELPATLFFWWLAIEVSFLPTMKSHQRGNPYSHTPEWMSTMNKVLVSLFVCAILNFVEKILIQLIAISFHLRTYADRIEINKFQIGSLAKLYKFSKEKIAMEDSEFEAGGPGSGARTPAAFVNEAAKQTKEAMTKFGDVAGKIAGDFTGRQVTKSTHPNQVVLSLLHTTSGSQVLARRLYRTFAREETETVHSDDLRAAFENDDEADAAFSMFDKDMNGDISMEELEAVCVEIGRERKSITASLKDLDSVVAKLDDVFMFVVFVITVLVFISLISTSAAGVLTSAGSTVLALSWLFSATAQEFLQSVIFVFVKHPFDVGDRVTIYGNSGSLGRGDDYFVKEIALLYTEFKKMEGHVVQAPNSYLNTLFVLNMRRSGGLAEAVSITIKFGTTLEQIEGLRNKLLEFVKSEKREYQGNILTELRDIVEAHAMNLNIVFFYKSNWQNEGLRLARRNKFICAVMVCMQELGIEGPRMRFPGQKESFPVYLQQIPHMGTPGTGHGGHPDNPTGWQGSTNDPNNEPFVAPVPGHEENTGSAYQGNGFMRARSSTGGFGGTRRRNESVSQMGKRVDFSLGMSSLASGDMMGELEDRDANRNRLPISVTSPSPARGSLSREGRSSQDQGRSSSISRAAGGLARRSTESGLSGSLPPNHRNRFFSRNRPGTGDEAGLMERGELDDVPENPGSGANSARMDPRSGLVSPAAWRTTTNESNLHPPNRSQTEDFEMRRMR